MSRPPRSLRLVEVASSLAPLCAVCEGDRAVRSLFPGTDDGVERDCPHCSPSDRRSPIPIYVYAPYKGDLPNGAA